MGHCSGFQGADCQRMGQYDLHHMLCIGVSDAVPRDNRGICGEDIPGDQETPQIYRRRASDVIKLQSGKAEDKI